MLEVKVGWYFIKTPHSINLYIGDTVKDYNPETGEYEQGTFEVVAVPCYASFMNKGKQFEEYGSRDKEIIIVRFNHDVPLFDKAELKGKFYRVLEETQVKDKKAFRLERVAE